MRTTHSISHGVILHRYCIDTNPDAVGTPEFWDVSVKQLYAQLPFREYWNGLELHIWHMDSPELDQMRKLGIVSLEDYDLSKSGNQVAAGLFHNKRKLEIGVFPPDYRPDKVSALQITDTQRIAARRVLSHEAGHLHASQCGYGDNSTYIRKQITKHFDDMLQKSGLNLGPNGEAWAELYRASMGDDDCRGTFSDGKPCNAPSDLLFLIRSAYWLQGNLAKKIIDNLSFYGNMVIWQEYKITYPIPLIPQLVTDGWFGLDHNWTLLKWVNNTWIKT